MPLWRKFWSTRTLILMSSMMTMMSTTMTMIATCRNKASSTMVSSLILRSNHHHQHRIYSRTSLWFSFSSHQRQHPVQYWNAPPHEGGTRRTFATSVTTSAGSSNSDIVTAIADNDQIRAVTDHSSSSTSSSSSSSSFQNIPTIVLKRNVQSRTFRDGNQLIYRKSFQTTATGSNTTAVQHLKSGDVVQVTVEQQSSSSSSNAKKKPFGKGDTRSSSTTASATTAVAVPTNLSYAIAQSQTTPIGFGIYNAYSLYTIRLLCHNTIQPVLYKELAMIMKNQQNDPNTSGSSINQRMIRCMVQYHIIAAIQLRQYLTLGTTTASADTATTSTSHQGYTDTYRLLNGEGDGMSGLAIDVIGGNHIVVMSSAIWCELYKDIIMEVLQEQCTAKLLIPLAHHDEKQIHIVWKTAPARLLQDGMDNDSSTSTANTKSRRKNGDDVPLDDEDDFATTMNDVPLDKEEHPMVLSMENGIYYETYPSANGQKTGVYSDQRSNRYMITQYCQSKRVLDLCCYTGGFTLNAMIHGNATSCVGVDSSPTAIATCYANAKRNHLTNDTVSFIQSDITTYLQQSIRDRIEYDIVILDPPKLAPSIKLLDKAKRKYHALNRDAISIISQQNGGLLLSCTCSAAMTQDDGGQTFLKMIQTAAQSCSKHVTLLNVYGAASCHTQSPMAFPASNYLTAALFYVHPKR